MGRRRKQSGLDTLAAAPWPVGVVFGIAGFIAVRYGIVWWMSSHSSAVARGFARQWDAMSSSLAWMLLGFCWLAALVSYLRARRKRRFLDTRTTLESLAAGGWRQFEQLVGEAFRRQGYSVEETGLGGADGGIDLILRKDGRRTLVQCKQWKRQQVGVSVVREVAGLLAHYQADAVKIVCTGTYTQDAARFAQGKPIELIDGGQLLDMIRVVHQNAAVKPTSSARVEPVLSPMSSILAGNQAVRAAVARLCNERTGAPMKCSLAALNSRSAGNPVSELYPVSAIGPADQSSHRQTLSWM